MCGIAKEWALILLEVCPARAREKFQSCKQV
jgi:hypothetical protein